MQQRDQDQNEQDQRDQEQSEDYGYDLAHEIPACDLRRRTDPAHRGHHDPGPRAEAAMEPTGITATTRSTASDESGRASFDASSRFRVAASDTNASVCAAGREVASLDHPVRVM
jgi:hypothetical protein